MWSNLSTLWEHIPHHRRKRFFALLALMVAASFAEVISIGAVLPFLAVLTNPEQLYDYAFTRAIVNLLNATDPHDLLLPLTIIFSLAALFSGGMRLTLLWAQTRLSHAVGADLSISIYQRTLYQPYAVHVARNSGEVITGVSQKANEVVHLTILPILIILSSSIMLVAILLALFLIEPTIAIVAFSGFGAIYATIIGFSKKRLMRHSQIVAHEQNQVIKALNEGLGGIRDVLIDGTQQAYCKIFRSAELPLRRARANIQIISGSPRFGIEALGMMLIAWIAFFLAGDSDEFANSIPVLGALALGAQRLLPVLQQAYANWALIRGGQASLEDALDLLAQPIPKHAHEPPPKPIQFLKSITLDKIGFSYSPQSTLVLKGISLTIQKGSRVGFIGTTGSGKSTLLDIVMGLLQPTEGHLKIDDEIVSAVNHRAWQAHIAHVPQAIFLADTTIAENIALGMPVEDIDINRVREAARKALIADTIESLEHQYNTTVGERGVRLSGGQRQRIGIARALYKNADVIVFDEATSALDGETESAVMEAIEEMGQDITILIIAHRLATLKGCNQIIELNDGVIQQVDSYENIVQS
jgi:ATP-binding cassette, subfamily B, bacterial PglK